MYQVMDARFVGLIFSFFNTDPNLVSLLDIVSVNPFSPRDVEDIIIWLHGSLHSRHLELIALKGDVFPSCLLHFLSRPLLPSSCYADLLHGVTLYDKYFSI